MLVLASAVSIATAAPVRHAVVIGANDGGGVLEPLRYAETDAERVGSVLVELGEFDDQLVTVLFRPTEGDLRAALAKHAAIAEQYDEDLFLFYYSGHADASGLRLGDERYFFEALKHDLNAIQSDVRIGILDACRSGTITRLKGADVTESMFGVDGVVAEGEAWLTASAADELAQESESLRGGFFTHYLLSGMRGAADTGDGVIQLDELYRYTFDRVVDVTGRTGAGTQHPHFDYQLSGAGALGLTDVRNASALLVLPEGSSGQVAVFKLPEKTQLAEFVKAETREMAIAVPPGTYLVRRRFADATYEATFGINDGAQFRVENWGTPVMELGVARGDLGVIGDDPRVAALIEESLDYQDSRKLGASPAIAGTASVVIPGAGQLYNGQVWKGLGYFAVTSSTLAGVVFDPTRDQLGNGFWPMVGAAVWGASIADAAYNVHRNEDRRPQLGFQLSTSTTYGGNRWPTHFGVSGDLMLRKGVSIGLDRVGYTPVEGGFDGQVGSRLLLAVEGGRFRPHMLVALGARYGRVPDTKTYITRMVVSAGGGVRYYVVPRYFVETEGRWENDGDWQGITGAIGMGVHFGR
ncbi:MAG: caspase family protein [Myxococcota bacterium]